MSKDPNRRLEAAKRRRALRDKALGYKGGKCQICGYDRSTSALEFHHLDPMEKDFAISARMTSWEVIKPELDKCLLVCSNCHREIHDGWHPGYLTFDDTNRGWVEGDDRDLELEDLDPVFEG